MRDARLHLFGEDLSTSGEVYDNGRQGTDRIWIGDCADQSISSLVFAWGCMAGGVIDFEEDRRLFVAPRLTQCSIDVAAQAGELSQPKVCDSLWLLISKRGDQAAFMRTYDCNTFPGI